MEPMGRKKLLRTAILLLIALMSASCSLLLHDETEPAIPPAEAATALSIWTCWDQAMALSREWRDDAYLVEIGVSVISPIRSASDSRIGYGFRCLSEDLIMFSASCSSSTSEIRQREGGFDSLPSQEGCVPITREDIAIDSSRALEIALLHGGERYLWHEDTEVSLNLQRNYPRCGGRTYWSVHISHLSLAEASGITVIIDAVTGEVTDIWK
jgi:hypothetical protein